MYGIMYLLIDRPSIWFLPPWQFCFPELVTRPMFSWALKMGHQNITYLLICLHSLAIKEVAQYMGYNFVWCFWPELITLLIVWSYRASVRECTWKKIDRGARFIFLGLKFLIFLFFWVWKNLSYNLGLKIFHLVFWSDNFDTIYFLGRLNDLDLQNRSTNNINEWR